MNKFFSNVYMWLFFGLLVTFLSGYSITVSPALSEIAFSTGIYIVCIIAQLILCIVLSARIRKMSPTTAKVLYLLYCLLTGITFSTIFVVYELSSIMIIFLATSIVFGAFAIIGKVLNIDVSKIGIMLFMALISVVVLGVINIFLNSATLDMGLAILCIVIFMGYIIYDIQRIKQLADYDMNDENMAIYGAFQLYLDFINIFIDLLRIFGKERD